KLCLLKCFLSGTLISFFSVNDEIALAVGGISNSKVVVPSAETVEKGHIEIEPFFGLEFVDDKVNTLRSETVGRFTIGVLHNLEIGTNFGYLNIEDSELIETDRDFGDIEAGLKYRFLDEDKNLPFSLAYQGGITFPTSGEGAPWVFEVAGLILTKDFTERFSMDADFVFALIEDNAWSFVTEVGFGYFIASWFQFVVEGAYAFESPDNEDNVLIFNITVGFTAPITEWLTIIIGVTPDIYTKNIENKIILSSAFTFLF
ncbi:MAG TPA: transporter, partial [Thermodesulfobacteriota bacterium]